MEEVNMTHMKRALNDAYQKLQSLNFCLSKREKEILFWLAEGKSNWDVSVILGISERTIRFHIKNVMKKLNAVNRTHAVAIAICENIIDPRQNNPSGTVEFSSGETVK